MNFLNRLLSPFRWLLKWPLKLLSAPKRLMGLSLPVRAALIAALFLVTCTIVTIIVLRFDPERGNFFNYAGRWGWKLGVMALLIFAISFAIYKTLKLWLEGNISRFPDIDRAWNEGLATLAKSGFDLRSYPIFMVIGSPDDRTTSSLMSSASTGFTVDGVPEGRQPLRWYADENAIYLAITDTGCLARLNKLASTQGLGGGGGGGGGAAAAPGGPKADIRGTLVAGGASITQTSVPSAAPAEPEPEPAGGAYGGDIRGTLVPNVRETLAPGGSSSGSPSAPAAAAGAPSLSRQAIDEQSERLAHICRLLNRERQPLCPLNGVMTLLPYSVIENVMAAKELPAVVKNDMATIRETTRLHCPITALVTGMETESGFSELIRRVGVGRAKTHRFGKGFDVWNLPSAENIDALSSHACGAFEDWVYNLFREENGLSKPGNSKLYTLLCRIRSHLHLRLRNVLVHAYSFDASDKTSRSEPLLFSGCYFSATGESEDRQAFVKNVFEKMGTLEEELEWTESALSEDDRYYAWAQIGMLLNAAVFIGVISMFVYLWWSSSQG